MNKITNLKSESLFRQACDYFYLLDNPKLALKCVDGVLKIVENHPKAHNLKGEIMLYTDNVEKALESFLEFHKILPFDFHNLANIALCNEMLEDYEKALEYCDLALENFNDFEERDFLTSLYELKISLLIKTGNRILAKHTLESLKKILYTDEFSSLGANFGRITGRADTKNITYLKVVR